MVFHQQEHSLIPHAHELWLAMVANNKTGSVMWALSANPGAALNCDPLLCLKAL